MVWAYVKVFWISKDNSAGHNAKRKKRKHRQEKRWEDSIKEWTVVDFAISARATKTGLGGKGLL